MARLTDDVTAASEILRLFLWPVTSRKASQSLVAGREKLTFLHHPQVTLLQRLGVLSAIRVRVIGFVGFHC